MFDIDNWLEILHIIKKNKLRTFLTGFAVAWGIFMLIILLAAGSGLKNGVTSVFGERAKNRIDIYGGSTSIPYKGSPDKRTINLEQKDYDLVNDQVPESDRISGRISSNSRASRNQEFADCGFNGVNPDFKILNGIKILGSKGRFINDNDIKERRKVAVINERLKTLLFKDEDPIGKNFDAYGLVFQVVGVYKGEEWGDDKTAYIPFSTAQQLFNKGWGIGTLSFTVNGLNTKEENEEFEIRLRKQLSLLHQFDPSDENAVYIRNRLVDFLQTMSIFSAIDAFILVIALGTLIAGIVGVSNIMLITVRERTREFGIRKALGAKPSSILKLIFMESMLITAVFGYIGMFLGILTSEVVNYFMTAAAEASEDTISILTIFKNPTVNVNVALGATFALVIAGIFSGLIPAYKAVRVTAIEAMRAE